MTMPAPQPEHAAGKALAEDFSSDAIWSGVSAGLTDSIRAATPLTTGVAIEVPMLDA